MDATTKLLDKAIAMCIPPNASALAARVGVKRQLVSKWKSGESPMADHRVIELAKIANEDPSQWLAQIHAETAEGDVAKTWANMAKKLGYAATLAFLGLAATSLPGTAYAASQGDSGRSSCNLYIMSTRRLRAGAKRQNRGGRPRYFPAWCAAA